MIEKAHDLPPAEDHDAPRDALPGAPGDDAAPEAAPSGRVPRARSGRSRTRARAGLPQDAEGAQAALDAAGADLAREIDGAAGAGIGAAQAAAEAAASGEAPGEETPEDAAGTREELSRLPLGQRIEALLFASGQPLAPMRIANVLEVDVAAVNAALDGLVAAWRERPGAVDLVEIAGGYRFMTRAAFHADVAGLRGKVGSERLSPAALETLAVVAYRQPIGRAEVEAVRGVQVGPVLRLLLDRDLIRVTGRSTEPGHPLLYGTTKRFLDHFGLKSLKALPDLKDLLESP